MQRAGRLRLEEPETRVVASATYFVSPAGNDANTGLEPERPWRTIARVNAHRVVPGDTILFEGGATFTGTLDIYYGDPGNPITVASYGDGRATIASGNNRGLWACSPGGLYVVNLNFVGSGADNNEVSGLEFCNSGIWPGRSFHYGIADVDVSGYGLAGITFTSDFHGMQDIAIYRVRAHHNANGLHLGNGDHPSYRVIENLWIADSVIWENDRATPGMAGIGIGLSNVVGALIERNVLHNNGHQSWDMGHAGLLVNDSSYVYVQYNEAYSNDDPNNMDGQGFAFNGVTDSVFQFNYSHDNRNAGLVLMGEDPDYPSANNVVRYNIFENDRVGISVNKVNWGAEIYNNTVYAGEGGPPDGFRVAAAVTEWVGARVHFRNNIFVTNGYCAAVMLDESSLIDGSDLFFQNNAYYALDGQFETFVIFGADAFFTLAEWRDATWQETLDGKPVGWTVDPRLEAPGWGGTIDDAYNLHALTAYQLQSDSPILASGLDLAGRFGLEVGIWDFYGNLLPSGFGFSIGAHQYTPSKLPAPRDTPRFLENPGFAFGADDLLPAFGTPRKRGQWSSELVTP